MRGFILDIRVNYEQLKIIPSSLLQNGYLYSRWGNPTVDVAAETIACLEGAEGSLLFSSGCAAISTCMTTFAKCGDHMVYGDATGMHCVYINYNLCCLDPGDNYLLCAINVQCGKSNYLLSIQYKTN